MHWLVVLHNINIYSITFVLMLFIVCKSAEAKYWPNSTHPGTWIFTGAATRPSCSLSLQRSLGHGGLCFWPKQRERLKNKLIVSFQMDMIFNIKTINSINICVLQIAPWVLHPNLVPSTYCLTWKRNTVHHLVNRTVTGFPNFKTGVSGSSTIMFGSGSDYLVM